MGDAGLVHRGTALEVERPEPVGARLEEVGQKADPFCGLSPESAEDDPLPPAVGT